MDDGEDDGPVSFVGRPTPAWTSLRQITISAGDAIPYDTREWTGALVVIEAGRLELENTDGDRIAFATGDVVCLFGLPLCALHGGGTEPTVLSVLSRRDSSPGAAGEPVEPA